MSKLSELKDKLSELWDQFKDSELYRSISNKYDELDSKTKLVINLSVLAFMILFVFTTVISGMSKVSGLSADINEREEMIGFLQRSSDNLKQLKAQQEATQGNVDTQSELNKFVEDVSRNSGFNPEKVSIAAERPGKELKDAKETMVDVKITQINVEQMTKFMFDLTDQGSARSLTIKDLTVDTKGDPSGYVDVNMTVAAYRTK